MMNLELQLLELIVYKEKLKIYIHPIILNLKIKIFTIYAIYARMKYARVYTISIPRQGNVRGVTQFQLEFEFES